MARYNKQATIQILMQSLSQTMKLKQMADAGQIQIAEFAEREKLLIIVKPVQDKFAASINATELLEAIRNK